MSIHPHNNATRTRWDKGGFKIMLRTPEASDPFGYCDGDDEDEQALYSQAEEEGAEVSIERKHLKTGREIWTIRTIG